MHLGQKEAGGAQSDPTPRRRSGGAPRDDGDARSQDDEYVRHGSAPRGCQRPGERDNLRFPGRATSLPPAGSWAGGRLGHALSLAPEALDLTLQLLDLILQVAQPLLSIG